MYFFASCIIFAAKYYGGGLADEDCHVCDSFRLAFGSVPEVEGSETCLAARIISLPPAFEQVGFDG